MTADLTASLTRRIQQAIRLDDIQACAAQIDAYYRQGELLEHEHQDLLDSHKKQLKFILDINLLPTQTIIDAGLDQQNIVVAKADPAEITVAEFQMIEQEALRLNRARLDYIQEHFFSHTSSLHLGHNTPPKPKQPTAWKQLLHFLRLK